MAGISIPGKGRKGFSKGLYLFFIVFMCIAAIAIISLFINIISSDGCSCLPSAVSVKVERINDTHILVETIDTKDTGTLDAEEDKEFYSLYANGHEVPVSYFTAGPVASSLLGSRHYFAVEKNADVTVVAHLEDNTDMPVWAGTV